MADKLTPDKEEGNEQAEQKRLEIIRQLAKMAKKQGNFHLACKKYTQCGEKLKAIKSLLKQGDTDKITNFATTAKNKDVYVLAANYLQSSDWHNEPDVMKNIISF